MCGQTLIHDASIYSDNPEGHKQYDLLALHCTGTVLVVRQHVCVAVIEGLSPQFI